MWEIVVGGETTPPKKAEAFWKWKIKTGNAMFAIKTSVKEEMLEYIRWVCKHTKGIAWDTFVTLISKKNNVGLQLLENEMI